MARVVYQAPVESIHGRVGNLVFQDHRRVHTARRYVVPRQPVSAAQQAVRRVFGVMNDVWFLHEGEEIFGTSWRARALLQPGAPRSYWVGDNMFIAGEGVEWGHAKVLADDLQIPFTPTATAVRDANLPIITIRTVYTGYPVPSGRHFFGHAYSLARDVPGILEFPNYLVLYDSNGPEERVTNVGWNDDSAVRVTVWPLLPTTGSGPYTPEAWGLGLPTVLDVPARPGSDLQEEARL